VYNDLDVFVIQNKDPNGATIAFSVPNNSFDATFIDCLGNTERLKGCITSVWSGNLNFPPGENGVLKANDKVYFLGKHNKSCGTVERFVSQYAEIFKLQPQYYHSLYYSMQS